MTTARSLVFNVFMFTWTAIHATALCLFLPFGRKFVIKGCQLWAKIIFGALKIIIGIDYQVLGSQHITTKPVIFASKHQSMWDTLIFNILLAKPSYIVKRELLWIPFYGAVIKKLGVVALNRSSGAAAIKSMIRGSQRAVDEGHQIVIFPEGTRTAPGAKSAYLPGVAALYKQMNLAVVPVALNSGKFWGRRSFIKYPGTITIEFLEPIQPGLNNKEFMKRLENSIECATANLIAAKSDAP